VPCIAVLPSAVADQIAAGEVVERPASVVKELLENAVDAGATTIDISIADGGRAEIRVSDDGAGMSREDAVLSLERHATSKIREAADLLGVRTFGFRGEALPAICSVSHVEILTSTGDNGATVVRASGGQPPHVSDAARRRGTTVAVTNLFFNVPARQKFLRGARSEWRAIAEAVTTLALVRLDLRVAVTHDGREVLVVPPAPTLRDRVASVWGAAIAESLVLVDDVAGPIHVAGLTQRPSDVGTAARHALVLINGRAVRDAGLIRAAEGAYRSTIAPGLRPSMILDVTVPDDTVDVNVHPAKAEVRFRNRWDVEQAVQRAVRRALGAFDSAATFGAAPRVWTSSTLNATVPARDLDALAAPTRPADADGLFAEGEIGVATVLIEDGRTPVPRLTQVRSTFMQFEHDDGLVLIDQHSAHERVLYERFLGALDRGDLPAQRLLFPLTLHVAPAEADVFEEHRLLFERLGFDAEGFGGHSIIIRSVPTPHPRFDAERCVRETLATLSGDRHAAVATRHERLAATVACKAAIKAGDVLSIAEMEALYRALTQTTLPAHDVHGRATIVHLTWDELERRFGRR
jgi:DNA mismatch repair protein MutL